jgi:hypothetical protein
MQHAGSAVVAHIELTRHSCLTNEEERMIRRRPPRKVTYFEPVPPRLARNTVIESTFEVGRRFHCTMRIGLEVPDVPSIL